MKSVREVVLPRLERLVRTLSAGTGLSVGRVDKYVDDDLVSDLSLQSVDELTEVIATAVRLMPTSPQKLAIAAALNLTINAEGTSKLEVRRARVMQEIDISYSTVIRLERVAAAEIAALVMYMTFADMHWPEFARMTDGKVFSVQSGKVLIWPDWVESDLYTPGAPFLRKDV